ncbi:MAG: ATP-grasp domain-containing protein [Acidimicrobiales bacterium]
MPLLLGALDRAGVVAWPVAWDDPVVDWGEFSLVVVRSTWDYIDRRDEFVDWARSVPRLANPATVLEWNTDKRYLADMAAAGVPVPATTWVAPGERAVFPAGPFVVKPTVSSGSQGSARYQGADPDGGAAGDHVAQLHAAGQTAMIQPYLGAVDQAGETALVFVAGRLSHAVVKGPMLVVGRAPGDAEHHDVGPRRPTTDEVAVATGALRSVPGVADPSTLLYARVDLVPGDDGRPVVLELELTEPSLFLASDPGAADRLAAAVTARAAATGG